MMDESCQIGITAMGFMALASEIFKLRDTLEHADDMLMGFEVLVTELEEAAA